MLILSIRGDASLGSRPSTASFNSVTHRNPKLMVRHGAEGIAKYIQYDQLMYFEDLVTGMRNDLTIWEAIVVRVGEVLKEQIIDTFTFRDKELQNRVKIGYAEYMWKRYSVYLVIPSERVFTNSILVLEQ